MTFSNEKTDFLNKKDRSKKGEIDSKMIDLVNEINKLNDYFTTSSCSGRIIITSAKENPRKDEHIWLFVSHNLVDHNDIELNKILENLPKNDSWFKMEAAILHVACKDVNMAKKLIDLARSLGFRRSGMVGISSRITVELVSTERIETIISRNNTLLFTNSYFQELIKESNKKLQQTWKKIDALQEKLTELK